MSKEHFQKVIDRGGCVSSRTPKKQEDLALVEETLSESKTTKQEDSKLAGGHDLRSGNFSGHIKKE